MRTIFSWALEIAQVIDNRHDLSFSRALGHIVEEMARAGEFQKALEAVQTIIYSYPRDKDLSKTAEMQANTGAIQDVFKTAKSIETLY